MREADGAQVDEVLSKVCSSCCQHLGSMKKVFKPSYATNKNKKKSSASKDAHVKVKEKNVSFAIGDEVLACWQDGLHYLAVIKAIDETKSKCHVSFEDGSLYWISFKNIRTTPIDDDILCTICGGKESKEHNEIIICDRCGHGHHQTCHTPVLDDECVEKPGQWFCRMCIFSKAARAGGALTSGPEADALRNMKQVLPYDASSLKWDATHKSNQNETYCYCGGPGIWYYKMIECYNCRQWFHEACLQCLDYPLLLGDRFYYFVCALCNNGEEYLKRIQLKWTDIAQLVMYNVSLKHNLKYFSLEEINNFLKSNWDDLQTQNLHYTTDEERMEKIVEVFKHNNKFNFQKKKDTNRWALVTRAAPQPSKPSYLREHVLKTKSEMSYGLLDCNDNYLPGDTYTDETQPSWRPDQQNVSDRGRSTADDTTEINHSQTPLFPSPSMFKYFLPSSTRRSLERGGTLPPALSSAIRGDRTDSESSPRAGNKRSLCSRENISKFNEPIEKRFLDYMERINGDITSYRGSRGRLACGEECAIRGRRLGRDGRTEYLVEWSGTTPNGC